MGPDDAHVSCTGAVTAHFTWRPDGPGDGPPGAAVVREDSAAHFGTFGPATGACDDGLGQSASTGASASFSDTRYTVKSSPGASFDVTCSPSASAGGDASPYGVYGSAGVSYKATVYPVILGLSGTTKDTSGSDNILIGQGCTGVLSAGPVYLDNYQWDVPGDTFAGFQVASDFSSGHASYLYTDPDWISPSPHWHWRKDETVTVSCTANASINGKPIGSVTGEREVKIWVPYYDFKKAAGPVSVDDYGSGLMLYAGGPSIGGGSWSPPGMNNGGRVGTPDLFRSQGTGVWQFVQIIHPNRWLYHYNALGISVEDPLNWNGHTALDNWWPYPGGRQSPPPAWPADSTENDPVPVSYWMEDSPSGGLSDDYYRRRVDESFDDFMMYLPPDSGYGAEWVSLHRSQWKWQGDVSRTGASWASGWAPVPPGYVSDLSSSRYTDHPEWQEKLTNDSMHY